MDRTKGCALEENSMLFPPKLASIIGDKEAILLSQIHYWLTKCGKRHDGKPWIYNSIKDWKLQFGCYSEKTIARKLARLKELGLIITARYNRRKYDRTNWYTIDYERLSELTGMAYGSMPGCGKRTERNDQMDVDRKSSPIPENTTYTNTKNNITETINPLSVNHRLRECVSRFQDHINVTSVPRYQPSIEPKKCDWTTQHLQQRDEEYECLTCADDFYNDDEDDWLSSKEAALWLLEEHKRDREQLQMEVEGRAQGTRQ